MFLPAKIVDLMPEPFPIPIPDRPSRDIGNCQAEGQTAKKNQRTKLTLANKTRFPAEIGFEESPGRCLQDVCFGVISNKAVPGLGVQ